MSVPLAAHPARSAEIAPKRPPPALARRAEHTRRLDLPDLPWPARAARAQVAELCRGSGLPELADRATLVASELVTNAIEHAAGGRERATLRLSASPAGLLIDVTDPDPAPPAVRDAGVWAEGGRGMSLVAAHSADWGWDPLRAAGGKTVWAWLPAADGRRPARTVGPNRRHRRR
jgi:anti-sigma regulatory factor (Ser/Thr protein kinase)